MTMNQWRWALLNMALLSHMVEPVSATDRFLETIGLVGLSGILIYELIWIPIKSRFWIPVKSWWRK